jgi:hypothetical protein
MIGNAMTLSIIVTKSNQPAGKGVTDKLSPCDYVTRLASNDLFDGDSSFILAFQRRSHELFD